MNENAPSCVKCGTPVSITPPPQNQQYPVQPPQNKQSPYQQKQFQQNTYQPPQYYIPVNQPPFYQQASQPFAQKDTQNAGWKVLGFFVPLAGFILYLIWREERPSAAKAAGKFALIRVIVNIAFVLLWIIAMVALAFLSKDGAVNENAKEYFAFIGNALSLIF